MTSVAAVRTVATAFSSGENAPRSSAHMKRGSVLVVPVSMKVIMKSFSEIVKTRMPPTSRAGNIRGKVT